MITVEMMVTRLEAGDSLHDAASFAYTSTAFPMLTGTLVTVAGFVCSRTIPTCCAGALTSVAARSVFTSAMLSLSPMGGGPAAGPYH
jgi:multidrug efflux pump subunit AcrB